MCVGALRLRYVVKGDGRDGEGWVAGEVGMGFGGRVGRVFFRVFLRWGCGLDDCD